MILTLELFYWVYRSVCSIGTIWNQDGRWDLFDVGYIKL